MQNKLKQITTMLALLVGLALVDGCRNEQDLTEAKSVAAKVHAHLLSREFAAIYEESAPGFKLSGSEQDFVSQMKRLDEALGPLKSTNEMAYKINLDSTTGRTYALLYKLEYEHGKAFENLVMVRSNNGQMLLSKLEIQPAE
jgi:hypothetical protein